MTKIFIMVNPTLKGYLIWETSSKEEALGVLTKICNDRNLDQDDFFIHEVKDEDYDFTLDLVLARCVISKPNWVCLNGGDYAMGSTSTVIKLTAKLLEKTEEEVINLFKAEWEDLEFSHIFKNYDDFSPEEKLLITIFKEL